MSTSIANILSSAQGGAASAASSSLLSMQNQFITMLSDIIQSAIQVIKDQLTIAQAAASAQQSSYDHQASQVVCDAVQSFGGLGAAIGGGIVAPLAMSRSAAKETEAHQEAENVRKGFMDKFRKHSSTGTAADLKETPAESPKPPELTSSAKKLLSNDHEVFYKKTSDGLHNDDARKDAIETLRRNNVSEEDLKKHLEAHRKTIQLRRKETEEHLSHRTQVANQIQNGVTQAFQGATGARKSLETGWQGDAQADSQCTENAKSTIATLYQNLEKLEQALQEALRSGQQGLSELSRQA